MNIKEEVFIHQDLKIESKIKIKEEPKLEIHENEISTFPTTTNNADDLLNKFDNNTKQDLYQIESKIEIKEESDCNTIIVPGSPQTFTEEKDLKNHEHQTTTEKIFCITCGKTCTLKIGSQSHKQEKKGEKPHKCNQCGKSFIAIGYLKRHELIHAAGKRFNCNECGKSFTRAAHLRRHELIHTGEKPHKCKQCEKSFNQLCSLRRHELVHADENHLSC